MEENLNCINLCPQVEQTDERIFDDAPITNGVSMGAIVELCDDDYKITVSEGQNVSIGDNVGYIRDLPVISPYEMNITEVKDNYFVADYIVNEDSLENLASSASTQKNGKVDDVCNMMSENSNVMSFIKDYILKFRFADIALNTKANTEENVNASKNTNNINALISMYDKDSDAIITAMNNNISSICEKDHITDMCEKDNLEGIQKEIIDEIRISFNKIINHYNNVGKYGFCSGKISDFMLYTHYLSYITGDSFVYDENNPYVVELFDKIEKYIEIRSSLEMNSANINEMIVNFNTMCDSTIKEYWSTKNKEYYSEIKRILSDDGKNGIFDFYASDEISEAAISDDNRMTLYKKVLNLLKTITKYKEPTSPTETYVNSFGTMEDVESIINGGSVENKEQSEDDIKNEALLKNLKKIAIQFAVLRKVENSKTSVNYSYFSNLIPEDDLKTIFSLKTALGDSYIQEYNIGYNNELYGLYDNVLSKYLGALKSITDSESTELNKLVNKAISWYNQNSEGILSGEIFNDIKEISWGGKTQIQYNGRQYDFFLLYYPDDTNENVITVNDDGSPRFTENSLETQYGINSTKYWLKYMTVATLTHCMLPIYWPTGLLTPTGSVRLPVIYIPIYVLADGFLITVFGFGICGLSIVPMIMFVNTGNLPACMIPYMNKIISYTKIACSLVMTAGMFDIVSLIKTDVTAYDAEIENLKVEIKRIDDDIKNISSVEIDHETNRRLKKKLKEDITSKSKKREVR